MKKLRAGIIGATGMVGRRFAALLAAHEWFEPVLLAASPRSAGKTYEEAVGARWAGIGAMPQKLKDMKLADASDVKGIASEVDFIFCAVNMKASEAGALEESYARAECPVISNNSAHRSTPDVPMIIPELNAHHAGVIDCQRKRLGVKRGFIAAKSNCSIQSFVPMLYALDRRFRLKNALACTYQAVSGAGRTLEDFGEIHDNIIPYISGEEKKSETEPQKIWGRIENGIIVPSDTPRFSARCARVPVSNGHLAAVYASFEIKPTLEEVTKTWSAYGGIPQRLKLPSAPERFIHCFSEPDRPQPRLDRDVEHGMAVCAGGLKYDSQYDISFMGLSHNTLRGAAGGAVLLAELLCALGYIG